MRQKGFAPLILLIFISLFAVIIGGTYLSKKNKSVGDVFDKAKNGLGMYPACPKDLSGILTYPLIDLKGVAAITPLGNIAPPGHTSPVDHNYFDGVSNEKVAVYAPADGWVTNITAILAKNEKTGKYEDRGITIDITICDGLKLTFANLTEASSILKDNWPKDDNGCKYDIVKSGHTYTEGQCNFHSNIKVKAGELLGYTQRDLTRPDSIGLEFEIWAANYNKPSRSDVNWDYYNDDRYAHIMCTFDLYSGELKKEFYSKFGRWSVPKNDDKNADGDTEYFVPRTVEPLCGQVNQDVTGTIQGMWFSKPTPKDDYNTKFDGGLAFLHNNIDPTQGEISIGGDLNGGNADVIFFNPTHSGSVDREPSEIKSDGHIYCYDAQRSNETQRFLVQLVDSHHLKAEIQNGTCDSIYSFIKPYSYER